MSPVMMKIIVNGSTPGAIATLLTALYCACAHSALSEGDHQAFFIDVTARAHAAVKHDPPVFDKKLDHIMDMIAAGASGGAIGDFNNDGWLDIFVNNPSEGSKNTLLRNNGDMTFTNIAEQAGVAALNDDGETSTMGLFFDYDGDGWQDLLVVRFGQSLLFRNRGNETFENVTAKAGLSRRVNSLAAVAFDFNQDGYLDIYLGSYFRDIDMFNLRREQNEVLHDSWEFSRNGGSNVFYVNNGNGTFSDKTAELGLSDTGWTMAIAHADLDNDGLQDIYVANDFGRDVVFKNTPSRRFVDVSKTAIGTDTKKGMNAEAGDFDNDGDLDLYVTNVTEEFLSECNMLWQNDGKATFVDVSSELNVCDTGWGWAGKFFDYNNDGLLDLYVANGFFTSTGRGDYLDVLLPSMWEAGEDPSNPQAWPAISGMSMASREPNVLFTHTGSKYRRETRSGLEITKDSRAILLADFNNDGRVDVFVTNNNDTTNLFENRHPNKNHWLQIQLKGKPPNTDAIGARLYVTAGGKTLMSEVNAGNGFGGGSMNRQHFGLGASTIVEELRIRWPDGEIHSYKNMGVDTLVHLHQSKPPRKAAVKK